MVAKGKFNEAFTIQKVWLWMATASFAFMGFAGLRLVDQLDKQGDAIREQTKMYNELKVEVTELKVTMRMFMRTMKTNNQSNDTESGEAMAKNVVLD